MHIFSNFRFQLVLATVALLAGAAFAQAPLESVPDDPFFADFKPVKAPVETSLIFKTGDKLAICGDSITEQKLYSRIIETYLTVCVPELKITTRQYGWGGETAEGFYRRMTNDCLRFKPDVATLCYGMNDHHYESYKEETAKWFENNTKGIVESFKEHGVRVILGSSSCIGKMPPWANAKKYTVKDMNLSLCAFRNIDIDLAGKEGVRFADVFWPMFKGGFEARQKYGANYNIAGKDGVHPGWNGHAFMARAFLKAAGLDGNIGTFTVDLKEGTATATEGHHIDKFQDNVVFVTSHKYPFCALGSPEDDNSIRSTMALIPFNEELNRLQLVVKNGTAANYKITWGKESHTYTAAQLEKGINLANDFADNPFVPAFEAVDKAVADKEDYETRQIKSLFHGPEGQVDMDATVALSEKTREPRVKALAAAFIPVTHQIQIQPQ